MLFEEYFGETHHIVRQTVRKFVEKEIKPYVNDWEEQGAFPRELYHRAGEAGILGIGYPEAFGGTEGDLFLKVAAMEEIARCGSGGVAAGLGSLDIGLPPILRFGREDLKDRLVPPILRGEKICALAITEPNAGSDVGAIQTRAVREGGGLPGERPEDLYHQRSPGRCLDLCGPDRRSGTSWGQPPGDRIRYTGV